MNVGVWSVVNFKFEAFLRCSPSFTIWMIFGIVVFYPITNESGHGMHKFPKWPLKFAPNVLAHTPPLPSNSSSFHIVVCRQQLRTTRECIGTRSTWQPGLQEEQPRRWGGVRSQRKGKMITESQRGEDSFSGRTVSWGKKKLQTGTPTCLGGLTRT